jgi:hypothetical protein
MVRNRLFDLDSQCESYATETTSWGKSYPHQECLHAYVSRGRERPRETRENSQLALIGLAGTVNQLRQRIEKLESLPQPLAVPINTFAPKPFEIVRPIMVLVEPIVDEDGEPCEYIATFPDGAISVTGDTIEEAMLLLKDRMADQYTRLASLSVDRLGKRPRQQRDALLAVMRRT